VRAWLPVALAFVLAAGCISIDVPIAQPGPAPTGAASASRSLTHAPRATVGPTASASGPSLRPLDRMSITLAVDNASAPAGTLLHARLDARALDAAGKDAPPAAAAWTLTLTRAGGQAAELERGTALPAQATLRLNAPGGYVLRAVVDAEDFLPAAVDLPLTALQPGCEPDAAPLATPTVRDPVALGPGAGEPNIVVAPDGTIYVTPIDHVYRSTDGGAHFQDLGTALTDGHGDGDIAVDGHGRLHWLGLGGSSASIPYQHSDDRAGTFSTPLDLSKTGSDREWIDARPEGVLYASWRDSADGGILAARTSFDDGATWTPMVTIAPDALGGPIVHGPVPGTVYEAFATYSEIDVAVSQDNGTHWESRKGADLTSWVDGSAENNPIDIFPVVAADCAGTLYLVYSEKVSSPDPVDASKRVARFGIWLASSRDDGRSWTTPALLSDPAHGAVMPWIAAGKPGHVAVTWYESTNGVADEVVPDEWNVKLWESGAADAPAPAGLTVQLNGAPNHVGAICTMGLFCLVGGDRSVLDYFEVTLDNAGQPITTWVYSEAGTGLGNAVAGPTIYVGGIATGTPLR